MIEKSSQKALMVFLFWYADTNYVAKHEADEWTHVQTTLNQQQYDTQWQSGPDIMQIRKLKQWIYIIEAIQWIIR